VPDSGSLPLVRDLLARGTPRPEIAALCVTGPATYPLNRSVVPPPFASAHRPSHVVRSVRSPHGASYLRLGTFRREPRAGRVEAPPLRPRHIRGTRSSRATSSRGECCFLTAPAGQFGTLIKYNYAEPW
jgi:hypothetical protein